MPLYTIIILALVQGITEFLPISSSGHLVLVHHFLGQTQTDLCWQQDRVLDIAVHIGTLFSVLLYFRKDLGQIVRGIGDRHSPGSKLAAHVALASLPVLAIGYIVNAMQPSLFCLLEVMAWMTLIFGIVLGVADKIFPATKTIEQMGWRGALFIGAAQAIALVPGTSRSGITMTAARILGYTRSEAAHFSLLLAIIAISAAGGLTLLETIEAGTFHFGFEAGLAALLAFVTGYAAITLMMRWLKTADFMPFAIYRVLLGGGLLVYLYNI